MEKRYIFRKVGKCFGCQFEYQDRHQNPCTSCERNVVLFEQLITDKFIKATMPEPPVEDDTDILKSNDKYLSDWGIAPKKKKGKLL